MGWTIFVSGSWSSPRSGPKIPCIQRSNGQIIFLISKIDLQISNFFLASEIMAIRKSGLVFLVFFSAQLPLFYNYFGYGPKWSDKGLVDHFDPKRLTLNRKGSQIERGSFFFYLRDRGTC